jgi:hypothetical protein
MSKHRFKDQLATVALLILALSARCSVAAEDPTDVAFLASVLQVEFDQHLSEDKDLTIDPARQLSVDRCEEVLRELRPGAVSVFAVGHEGWARVFKTTLPPHPALSKDTLAVWREACSRTGTPMYVYISSLINYKLNREHPEYARQFSNGGVAPQRLDHNSDYVSQCLIPFIETILQRYHPEGIWLDGDFWSIFPSWNPASVRLFKAKTGLAVPKDFGDKNFPAFWRFTIDSHADYMHRLATAIHQRDPNCVFAVNGAFTLRQPWAPPPYMGRTSIDPPTFFGLSAACLEARFGSAHPSTPLDIVLSGFVEPEGVPYPYPKTTLQLTQEVATILASGGHIKVYVALSPDGAIDTHDVRRIREVIRDFCLPRKECFMRGQSVPDIAILHTRDHFDRTHRLDEVHGAALALLRDNRHFDILDDETFCRRSQEYAVVVVPEQGALSAAVLAALDGFVRRGGGLVLSLPSGLTGDNTERAYVPGSTNSRPVSVQPALAQLVPLEVLQQVPAAARMNSPGGPIGVSPGWFVMQTSAATSAPGVPAGLDVATDPPTDVRGPARLSFAADDGRIVVFTVPVFRTFSDGPDPRLRAVISEALDWARGHPAPLKIIAPPWVEVSWRRTAASEIIHLVNHARGTEPRPRDAAVEYVPAADNILLERALSRPPREVRVVPSDAGTLESAWSDGVLHVTLPHLAVHAALVIDTAGSEGSP